MFKEKRRRSIVKTISWRILATFTTGLIVYLFTGKLLLAASVGGIEAVAKMILYFFHERAWDKLNFGRKTLKPVVLWFTGLSGAGKSTLADKAYSYYKDRGFKVERLDGDIVRSVFPKTGFTKDDRNNHVKRVGFLASMLERNGVIVISSFISPYKESREFVRDICQNFIEIYVSTPLEECEKRDTKGLYKKARKGEISNFTGISDPYEPPENPEVVIETLGMSPEQSFNDLKKHLDKYIKNGY